MCSCWGGCGGCESPACALDRLWACGLGGGREVQWAGQETDEQVAYNEFRNKMYDSLEPLLLKAKRGKKD